MRKRIIQISLIITILFITTMVQAVSIQEIKIDLPKEYTKAIQTNQIQDSNIRKYYEENHIYFNATNEEQNKSIIIAKMENELTEQIQNFDQLEEADQNIFMEKYNEVKQEKKQIIKKQEIVTYNDIVYLYTVFEQNDEENKLIVEEYYTIVNKSAYVISASYQNVENNEKDMKQVMISLQFHEENTEEKGFDQFFYTFIIIGMIILLAIIYFVKLVREKPAVENKEKEKILHQVKEYIIQKTNYEKFGGYLIFFYITIILNIINLFFGTSEYFSMDISFQNRNIKEMIYLLTAIIQNLLGLLGMIYIFIKVRKRDLKIKNHIENTLKIVLIGTAFLTILRFIIQASIYQLEVFNTSYMQTEIKVFLQSFGYLLVWFMYLKNSVRVSIYYMEKSVEEMILLPKTSWQKHVINKKVMEFKIIDYFQKEKALDYQSGIYINKLPKEYANSLSLSDLNAKKIIRLKKAKYYLSNKDLSDPNVEKKRALKIGAWVIIIAILCLWLVTTI